MSEDLNAAIRKIRERQEREKPLREKGYEGKKQWLVINERYGAAHVYAPDRTAAIYTAGRHWGTDPRRTEFHQNVYARLCR